VKQGRVHISHEGVELHAGTGARRRPGGGRERERERKRERRAGYEREPTASETPRASIWRLCYGERRAGRNTEKRQEATVPETRRAHLSISSLGPVPSSNVPSWPLKLDAAPGETGGIRWSRCGSFRRRRATPATLEWSDGREARGDRAPKGKNEQKVQAPSLRAGGVKTRKHVL